MVYDGKIPDLTDLRAVADAIKTYPVSSKEVAAIARNMHLNNDLIDFINLFVDRQPDRFESGSDFYTCASELALLIYEERKQPNEGTLGPQD